MESIISKKINLIRNNARVINTDHNSRDAVI